MKHLNTKIKTVGIVLTSLLLFNCNTTKKEEDNAQNITAEEGKENGAKGKTLMAVFAHPDDELTVAPILAKYVQEGAKVHLVIATDGRYGTRDGAFEPGEELMAMRREEMQCSANTMGVELIHLDYHDQLRSAEGYDGHIPHVRSLIKEIHGLVDKIKPDAIITFGPEGWSNHMDHRLVGATVTQVFVSKVWDKPSNLYYVGTPSDKVEDLERKIIRGQDRNYLTTRVTYTDEQKALAYNALACHVSQFGEDALDRIREYRKKEENVVYLRKFVAPPSDIEDSLF